MRAEASVPTIHKSLRAELGALSASKLRMMQAQPTMIQPHDPPAMEVDTLLPEATFSLTDDPIPDERLLTANDPVASMSPHSNNPALGKHIQRPSAKVCKAISDALPEGPGPLVTPSMCGDAEPSHSHALPLRVHLLVTETFRTLMNSFGLTREYCGRPSRVPDLDIDFEQLHGDSAQTSSNQRPKAIEEIIYPYPNISSFLLNRWFWNRSAKKSKAD
ncbi:hypothetical protein DEU56DRAFT_909310 [Suillus clintonianus]|uniref:uncharacterized protein n=1 Tax=Suillus clintonianus TaxID=1904413 RepID=UPI001B864022|nr:uncharacterized protein DEU56DRAFT_909310 [Suillus clintonianus]KAG2147960.1 hypothetical protein DEU56DRAFT_909310 [Suillus clintonianus]